MALVEVLIMVYGGRAILAIDIDTFPKCTKGNAKTSRRNLNPIAQILTIRKNFKTITLK